MNATFYGPKDDPYHSRLTGGCRIPNRRRGRSASWSRRRNYVDFVWATTRQDIRWNEEDYRNLVRKFEWMYDLGVRAFAIFFDDIGRRHGPRRQTELLNRLDADFVRQRGR